MKRLLVALMLLVAFPRLALAQFQHAAFFNGGTTLTATCHNTAGAITASDVFVGTLQGNTTVTLPAAAVGCVDYSVMDIRATQAAGQSFTLTIQAGTGTALKVLSNGGTLLGMPSAGAGITTNELHQIWVYNAVAGTPQWELVTQETFPAGVLSTAGGGTGTSSTLTGLVRGGNPFTASELSGDATTSGSNAVSVVKVNGNTPGGTCTNQAVTSLSSSAVPACSTITSAFVNNSIAQTGTDINTSNQVAATHLASALPINQGGSGTTSTLTGVMRGGSPMTATEISGDCTTSGSNAITCTKSSSNLFTSITFGASLNLSTNTSLSATNITTGTLPAAQLPNPSSSALGGVQSKAAVTHNFLNAISTSGVPGAAQPACGDLTDSGTGCSATLGGGATSANTCNADTAAGADLGAKINSCEATLGSSAGTILSTTPAAITTAVTISNSHHTLKFGPGTWTGTPAITISGTYSGVKGAGQFLTTLQSTSSSATIITNSAVDGFFATDITLTRSGTFTDNSCTGAAAPFVACTGLHTSAAPTVASAADGIDDTSYQDNQLIQNVSITNQSNGIKMGATDYSQINNVASLRNSGYGIVYNDTAAAATSRPFQWDANLISLNQNGIDGLNVTIAKSSANLAFGGQWRRVYTFDNAGHGVNVVGGVAACTANTVPIAACTGAGTGTAYGFADFELNHFWGSTDNLSTINIANQGAAMMIDDAWIENAAAACITISSPANGNGAANGVYRINGLTTQQCGGPAIDTNVDQLTVSGAQLYNYGFLGAGGAAVQSGIYVRGDGGTGHFGSIFNGVSFTGGSGSLYGLYSTVDHITVNGGNTQFDNPTAGISLNGSADGAGWATTGVSKICGVVGSKEVNCGIVATTLASHNFANAQSLNGVISGAQPAFTDISGTASAAQLPNPSASTLGGTESLTCSSSTPFLASISTSGVPACMATTVTPQLASLGVGTSASGTTGRVDINQAVNSAAIPLAIANSSNGAAAATSFYMSSDTHDLHFTLNGSGNGDAAAISTSAANGFSFTTSASAPFTIQTNGTPRLTVDGAGGVHTNGVSGQGVDTIAASNYYVGSNKIAYESICHGNDPTIAVSTTNFSCCGHTASAGAIATETNCQQNYPAACTISNLTVKFATTPASGHVPVFTVDKNTVGTALTCTPTGTNAFCNDATHTFTVVAQTDLISLKIANPASANSTGVINWSYEEQCQ